jgi:hypothetical protein
VLVFGDGVHSMRDAVILSHADHPFSVSPASGHGLRPVRFEMENVLFRRLGPREDLQVGQGSSLVSENCLWIDAPMHITGQFESRGTTWLGGTPSYLKSTYAPVAADRYRPSAADPAPLDAALQSLLDRARELRAKLKRGDAIARHSVVDLQLEAALNAAAEIIANP